MKVITITLIAMLCFVSISATALAQDEEESSLSQEETIVQKLDAISEKQDQILKELEKLHEAIRVVKVRATHN